MKNHAAEAEKFVADSARAHWHDEALWYVRRKRDVAASQLPEWEELREVAGKIKRNTVENLAYYLELFEREAQNNGIEIYWAMDARECNETVEKILREEGARRIVKSKSMLSEECGLNDYLQERGYEIVDTDLGERIVQLHGDRPSHIVLPAIHLKKEDVSEIFHEHMATRKGESDPEYLTKEARKSLRRSFLEADAAITGVNFALAREGAFVVCTNEGNADLGTAMAGVHIACMGIEKVIPSARELGVFTRLLARSATGQAVTTYTSHFRRPKAGGRLCVVIVDNGRSGLLSSGESEALSCMRCGACMNSCPVYRRSGGHSYGSTIPGPIGSVLSAAGNMDEFASLPFACTLCASCDNVCPSSIALHDLLYGLREDAIKSEAYRGKRTLLKAAAWLLLHPSLYAFVMNLYRRLYPFIPRRILYGRWNVWGRERELPEPAGRSFAQIYEEMSDGK